MTTWQITNKGLNINLVHSIDFWQFNTSFIDAQVEGRLQWNSEDGTLEYGLPGGNVTLQIGQEQLVKCTNKTAGNIPNGACVYISGAQGSRPTIALADSSEGTGKVPIGVATEDIDIDADGYVNVGGLVRGIDTSAISAGGIAFLSDTVPGAYRSTPPAAPNYTTIVGYCLFSNDTDGILFVRVLSAPRMQSMSDVDHTAPSAAGQFYQWSATNSRFELVNESLYVLVDGTRPMSDSLTLGSTQLTEADLISLLALL
jgi:hypothetical protein